MLRPCDRYNSSPDDPTSASPVSPCDPSAVAAKVTAGKLLGNEWADTLAADKVVLLARYGDRLARLLGDGYLLSESGVVRAVSKVALKVDELWVTFERTTPRAAVVGNPPPFNYMVAVDENGVCYGMPGLATSDSIVVWNFTTRMWEPRSTGSFPICVVGKLDGSSGIELIGFDPLDHNDEDFETTQRCVKGLCGTGVLFAENQPAPGECESCDGPTECGTTVVRAVSTPEFEDTNNPTKVYGWVFSAYTGPGFREIVNLEGGAIGIVGPQGPAGVAGAAGAPGAPGAPGTPGQQGPAGAPGPIGPSGGEQGPRGYDGNMGPIGPQGPIGPTGATGPVGPAGPTGPAGADGAPGSSGGSGGEDFELRQSDLNLFYVSTQLHEYLAAPLDITTVNGDSTDFTHTSSNSHSFALKYLEGVSGPVAAPADTSAGKLIQVDGVLLRIDVISTDPQDVEAGAAESHSVQVSVNSRPLVKLVDSDPAANAADAGAFLPRLSVLTTSTTCVASWNSGANMSVAVTSTKYTTLPAGSQFTKYNAGKNTVRIWVLGFIVRRKVIPLLAS